MNVKFPYQCGDKMTFGESLDKALNEAFRPGQYVKRAKRRRAARDKGPKYKAVKGNYGLLYDPDGKPLFVTSNETIGEIKQLRNKIFTVLQNINKISPFSIPLRQLLNIFNKGIDEQLTVKEARVRKLSDRQRQAIHEQFVKLKVYLKRLDEIIISPRMKENLKLFVMRVRQVISKLIG